MRHGILVLLAAASTLILAACGDSSAQSETSEAATGKADPRKAAEAAIPVEVVAPRRAEMLATYAGTATLEAEADAEVVARVGGEVRKILVEEGDRVRADQVLAVLDDRQLRLEVAQARAALAKLEQEHRRQVELHEKGLLAKGAFEATQFDLENLRASHELARLQLSYTEIRAPFAGVVAARNVKLGANLQQGAVAFRVTDPRPLKMSVFIPERQLMRLAPGQTALVRVDALPDRAFPGKVSLVSPTVDAQSATFKATIEIDDPGAQLKPGMFARVGIVFERRPQALQVPRVALVEGDGSQSVFVVQAGKAVQQPVSVGLSEAGFVEITSGLSGSEQVVVVGQNGLKPGADVRVVSLEQLAKRGAGNGRSGPNRG
jgi:membrane fusion protein (multidrug efflux system)